MTQLSAKFTPLVLGLILGITTSGAQKTESSVSDKPLIVSTKLPADSRGETVYESQGDDEKAIPVVPGHFIAPVPIKLPKPHYPASLKKKKLPGAVTVNGVISQSGDFIDAKAADPIEPDIAQSALDAVAKYKFHPATLDGKPIAIRAQVVVNFRIY